MRAIFVSYRRDDSGGEAGRLFDDLAREFGDNSVFMDVAAIEVGRDFRKAIDESVSTCGVLLALIGKDWLDAKDEVGQRRLDDPADFVRLETASALRRDIPVVPVLVRGAKMPRPEQLPEDLKELAYRNGVELTHARWNSDLQLLIKALRRHVESPEKEQDSANKPPAVSARVEAAPRPARKVEETHQLLAPTVPWRKSRSAFLAFLVIAALLGAGAAYRFWPTQATVPDLTGCTLSEATKKLGAAHLAVGRTTYQQDASAAPGAVLTQSPSPNTRMKSGTPVDLVMAGHPSVEIPTLTGKSLDDAKRILQDLHLAVGSIARQPTSSAGPNTVLDEFPKAGKKADPGTAIDLVVSVPAGKPAPPTVRVPNLVGISFQRRTEFWRTTAGKFGNLDLRFFGSERDEACSSQKEYRQEDAQVGWMKRDPRVTGSQYFLHDVILQLADEIRGS
jgi:TIR domain/PASTA domain